MSMHYEGGGIILNIDRIVRSVFASLVQSGQTEFEITEEMIAASPWQHYDLSSSWNHDKACWTVYVRDRRGQLKIELQTVADVEYEIIDERGLPSSTSEGILVTPKLLPRLK